MAHIMLFKEEESTMPIYKFKITGRTHLFLNSILNLYHAIYFIRIIPLFDIVFKNFILQKRRYGLVKPYD